MQTGRPEGVGGSQADFERQLKKYIHTSMAPKQETRGRSVYDMIRAPSLREAVGNCPSDLLELPEAELDKLLGSPPRILHALKLRFWELYKNCIRNGGHITLHDLTRDICTWEYFDNKVIADPVRVAWLVCPPIDEIQSAKILIDLGRKRLHEAMQLPLVTKEPKIVIDDQGRKKTVYVKRVNVPLIKALNEVVQAMEDRVHGSVIQRAQIEQKTLNVNVNQPAQLPQNVNELDQLADRIAQLKAELNTEQLALPAEVLEGNVEAD